MQRRQFIEELVLASLEFRDLGQHAFVVPGERIGRVSGVGVLGSREGGVRHERTQAGVVGLGGHLGQVLGGDGRVFAQRAQSLGHIDQLPFDPLPRHGPQSTVSDPG